MRNFVNVNHSNVQLTTASALVAGRPVLVEDMFFIPLVTDSETTSKTVSACIEGLFRLPKEAAASGKAMEAGKIVYWDAANNRGSQSQ